MYRKKKHLLGISCLLLFCVLAATVYGMHSLKVTNRFETGLVDISLVEYQREGAQETEWVDRTTILPGDKISKIPRIFNYGCDCYVRAGIDFGEMEELKEKDLYGISEDWMKADDGYFYYTKILSRGEIVDLFQGISIPEDFSQNHQGKTLAMKISVDAIQSKNFTPQFQTAAPWGTVEIVASKKEGTHQVHTLKSGESQQFQVIYEGNAKKLVSNAKDFFANIPYLMPGDVYSDSIRMVNQSEEPVKIYFQSVVEDEGMLPDLIQLEITQNIQGMTQTVYTGILRAEALTEDVILGVLPKQSEGTFRFQISVPSELNNQYAFRESAVTWIFSTEPMGNRNPGSVKTGDSLNAGGWFMNSCVALAAFFSIRWIRLSGRKEKKDEND